MMEDKSEYWKKHQEAQQRSGISIRGYCEQHQLKVHNFDYWRAKFRGEGDKKLNSFVRVVAKQDRETLAVARLSLGNGFILECMTWPSVRWLQELQA